MKLISCYHPKVITNKYTGEEVVARCGKCPACLNARAASWVQRLDNEMLMHKYTFFGTFQYDEQNVPQIVLLDEKDRPSKFPAYINYGTGEIYDLADVPDVTPADINYCENTKYLLVPNYKDFQNFIKLLRKYIYEKYSNERLRYYAAFEIGPTTFRPHIHSLFFLDSELLAKDFARLCSKCWKYGNVFDLHSVSGSASSYVASYVNSFTNLPKIYSHPRIRQKALFSKCPPIGTFTWTEKTLKQLFDSSSYELPLFRKDVSKFVYVPLWRSLQNNLYPKIVGFDRLSHSDRIILYELGQRFVETSDSFDYPSLYLKQLNEVNKMYLANFLCRDYWYNYRLCFETKLPYAHSNYNRLNDDSLKRFISVTSRVVKHCLAWNVSVADYVSKIEKFYEVLEKKQLSDYYYLQDEYFKSHPIKDFLSFNPNFCVSVAGKLPSQLFPWQKFYLEFYDPELLASSKPIFIHYNKVSAYNSLRGLHDKIAFDNTKQKKANDYLLAHKDKFNNIITYNEEIKNYVKSEII